MNVLDRYGVVIVRRPPSATMLTEAANVHEVHHPAGRGRTTGWLRSVAAEVEDPTPLHRHVAGWARFEADRVWARRWSLPGAWVLGEVADRVESRAGRWLCAHGEHSTCRGSTHCPAQRRDGPMFGRALIPQVARILLRCRTRR